MIAGLMVGGVAVGGCRGAERSSVAEWTAEWTSVQEVVPDAGDLQRPPRQETCADVLGELRARRSALPPAPDDVVATAADGWFQHAEEMFFDCFEGPDPDAAIRSAYDELERRAAEVDAALGG